MDNKEIQRQRMMTYFIDAAKEIIREEGIKRFTVRKVGDKAGYSYATIYNYFDDLNTLLLYCVFHFLEDCYNYIVEFKDDNLNPKDQLLKYSIEYFKYFAKNPNMFQLILVEDLGSPPKDLLENNGAPKIANHFRESFEECARVGYIEEKDIDLLNTLIGSSIHGKILYFLKRMDQSELDNVIASVEREIEFLINKK